MFPGRSIAQSGGRRIAVSVKTLADFFGRKLGRGVGIRHARSCRKKSTSDHGAVRVRQLNEKENEHCIKCLYLSPQRSNAGGERRNAIILSGSPRQSRRRAPASAIQPRRPLDCTPWAKCGERNRWHWTERGSGTPRFRRPILRLSETGDENDENSRFSLSRSQSPSPDPIRFYC